MAALTAGAFLYSVLCGLVPCDFKQYPTGAYISTDNYDARVTGPVLKNPYPVVHTNNGAVRGFSMGSMQGKQIFAFDGIRYGESTGGANRFKAPVPAEPWRGIRPAFKPGSLCLQFHPVFIFRVVGSEDCLFLNVYTTNLQNKGLSPERNDTEKFPVIVWIHGGIFVFGEGAEYGPAYLADKNLILVTVNYRLGVMGFLSTGDEASTGNYGLKDQALALKWVHENIQHFGGDPEKVTLMGQSAGAVAVHLHMLANKTRDYFQGAIGLSSTAFQHWGLSTPEYAKGIAKRLARIVKCPTHSSHVLVDCFKKMDPNYLVAHELHLFRHLVTPPAFFVPVIEPKGSDAFISDSAEELYERDEVAKYPFITTIIPEEGTILLYILQGFFQLTNVRRNVEKYFPVTLDYEKANNRDEITQKIRDFYFGTESPETVPDSVLVQPISDRYFTNGQIKGIKSHAQVAPTYSYMFKYRGRFTVFRNLLGWDFGPTHLDDVAFFFNSTRYFIGLHRDDPEYRLSQTLVNLIRNFAYKGEPLYTNELGDDVRIWHPNKPGKEPVFLQINNEKDIKMVGNPFVNRTAFWESLGLSDTTPFKPRKRIKT